MGRDRDSGGAYRIFGQGLADDAFVPGSNISKSVHFDTGQRDLNTRAQQRFEQLINTSPVFEHLHQKFKYELSEYLREKIEIVEGDVTHPNFGLFG